jgi:hemin uptake protein HemP
VSEESKNCEELPPSVPRPPLPRIVDARQLFLGCREVWIDHAGVRYRLRITRRNKLILHK